MVGYAAPSISPEVFSSVRNRVTRASLPSVQLTTYSRKWLTHTVYETKGVSPYNGWLRFIGRGLGSSNRAHHFFGNMVDAHCCVPGEGGFTLQWLVAFDWVRVIGSFKMYIT